MLGGAWSFLFFLLVFIGLLSTNGVVIAVGIMGLAVGGVSWLWNRLSLERVTYQRSLDSNHIFVGDETTLTIVVRNDKPIPLARLSMEDDIPDDLGIEGGYAKPTGAPGTLGLKHSTSMAWYEQIRWQVKIKGLRRGYYRLGPVRLTSGDLFGFFNCQRQYEDQDFLVVYPMVVSLPGVFLPPKRPVGDSRGGLKIFEDLSRPASIRDFQPGDPLNSIDWKATARRQSLQVKQFDPSVREHVVVLADANTHHHSWEGYSPLYLERVVTAAASVAGHAAESQYGVGLFSNGSPVFARKAVTLPPSRDPKQLATILEILASITSMTFTSMTHLIGSEANKFPIGATLVLVSSVLTEDLIEAMEYLSRLGYQTMVIFVGDEEPPPLPEDLPFYDLASYFARMESTYAGSTS